MEVAFFVIISPSVSAMPRQLPHQREPKVNGIHKTYVLDKESKFQTAKNNNFV